MSNPSPCLRILTSLTSVGKRNSCGSRTAWLAPFRNMDARRATAADICLAAVFDVTDLFFPVRVRFIWVPQIGLFRLSICFAMLSTTSVLLGSQIGGVFRTNLAGFKAYSIELSIFGASRFDFRGLPLENIPNSRWLAKVHAGGRWTTKRCF
jgi:hypothetical protein